jgi:hypothetical protein
MKTNIPHAKTEAELIERLRIVQAEMRAALDGPTNDANHKAFRALLIEQGAILATLNPTTNPLA